MMSSLCVLWLVFFLSIGRRHTSCALVTGVQTCALPISLGHRDPHPLVHERAVQEHDRRAVAPGVDVLDPVVIESGPCPAHRRLQDVINGLQRSEERRVGKECVSTCRSRWSPYHYKKKQKMRAVMLTSHNHKLQNK